MGTKSAPFTDGATEALGAEVTCPRWDDWDLNLGVTLILHTWAVPTAGLHKGL